MISLGERLEEARKRKGVSIREAAEATKIRSEYLESFEANDFEINLPDIYRRGFVKIYSRYLGEDPDESANEVRSVLGRKRGLASSRPERPSYGQMEVAPAKPKRPAAEPVAPSPDLTPFEEPKPFLERLRLPAFTRPRLKPDHEAHHRGAEYSGEESDELDRTFFLKVGVVVASITLAVIIIIGLIKLFSGSEGTATAPATPTERTTTTATIVDPGPVAPAADLLLAANDGSTWVAVKDVASGEILFRGVLNPGDNQRVAVQGEVEIVTTRGEFLSVQKGGASYNPTRSGTVKIRIP